MYCLHAHTKIDTNNQLSFFVIFVIKVQKLFPSHKIKKLIKETKYMLCLRDSSVYYYVLETDLPGKCCDSFSTQTSRPWSIHFPQLYYTRFHWTLLSFQAQSDYFLYTFLHLPVHSNVHSYFKYLPVHSLHWQFILYKHKQILFFPL